MDGCFTRFDELIRTAGGRNPLSIFLISQRNNMTPQNQSLATLANRLDDKGWNDERRQKVGMMNGFLLSLSLDKKIKGVSGFCAKWIYLIN